MPRTTPNEIKTAAVAKLADMSEPTLTSCLLYRRILLQVSMITIKVLFSFPRGHTSCSAYTKVSDAFPSQPLSIFIIFAGFIIVVRVRIILFLAGPGCWGRLKMRRRNIGNKIGGKLFSIVLEELLVLPRSSWLSQTSWHSEDWPDHHCAIPNSTDVRNFLHSRDRVWVWIRRDACSHCANPKHKRCKCVER